jgi:hypothetical protein
MIIRTGFRSQQANSRAHSADPLPEVLLRETTLWGYGFGGLSGRYKDGHYKDVRLVDPWTARVLRFRTNLYADSWLLRAFSPETSRWELPRIDFRVLDHGRLIKARPFMALHLRNGHCVADLVSKAEPETAKWEDFCTVMKAHGFNATLRTPAEIYQNTRLLDNLEAMRSHLVRHAASLEIAIAVTPRISELLRKNGTTQLRDIYAAVSSGGIPTWNAVQLAIYRGYRRREFDIDITSEPVGEASKVTAIAQITAANVERGWNHD